MAVRFLDSFDHYQTADITKKWTTGDGTPDIASGGRTGNRLWISGAEAVSKTLDSQATWVVGFAWQTTDLGADDILRLKDGGTTQCYIAMNANGTLSLVNGDATTIATSSTPGEVLSEDTWYYIELKVTIGNSAAYELKVNNASWFSGTGDTQNSGNATADVVQFLGFNTFAYLDDLYVLDGTGGVNDDFLGDVTIECLMPNGNGTTNNFTGSDGNSTDNYLLVDEEATDFPDDDTTYAESGTVGHIDLYAMEDSAYTAADASVLGVQVLNCAKKSDTGTKTMCTEVRHSAANYDGDTYSPSDSSYSYFRQCYDQDPAASGWTITSLNALEAGAKIVS